MKTFNVWLDGVEHYEDSEGLAASGYRNAVRVYVKEYKQKLLSLGLNNKKVVIHVEKTYGDKRNRFMYFVTLGDRCGVKKIE